MLQVSQASQVANNLVGQPSVVVISGYLQMNFLLIFHAALLAPAFPFASKGYAVFVRVYRPAFIPRATH